jgi:hypothetical protein
MREIMREIKTNQFDSEERLVGALRRLSTESSRAASPDLGTTLANAFRRHHRRRRTRNVAIAALAIACLVAATVLLRKPEKAAPSVASTAPSDVSVPSVPSTIAATNPPANAGTLKIARHDAQHDAEHDVKPRALRRQRNPMEARFIVFLPLPSYDPAAGQDGLQVVRVEMPIQDLRLVGAPVGADVPNRVVQADFAVGPDGTPYGVRLVQ